MKNMILKIPAPVLTLLRFTGAIYIITLYKPSIFKKNKQIKYILVS
jgi:hypothetical protein